MPDKSPTEKQREMRDKIVGDQKRLGAVEQTTLVNSIEEESFDRLTRLASKLLKTPVSFVTLLEKDRDFVKSHYGLPQPISESREITAHPSFCQHIITHREPLIIEDARTSEIFKDFPSVKHMGVVAYAGMPLITPEGYALGTCCVLDFKKRSWTDDEIEILSELTKSVLTEIELRKLTVKLEKETATKDEFISIAAHELKTPLTSLKMFSQLLHKKMIMEKEERFIPEVKKIDGQVTKIHSLISQLFDTSSMQRSNISLQKNDVIINELIEKTVEEFVGDTSEGKPPIIFTTQALFTVCVDQDRITQVVRNLLSNAFKYAPHSQKIDITIEEIDSRIKVSVKDYGPGISEVESKKIFDRFYQVKNPNDHVPVGLGLGLYICATIIQAHGGVLGVESELGKGSTFYFTLPK
ncbi:MAG: GAF domain-containing sensor histidine kinase [Patescibacteria group bacterium]